MNGNQFIFTVPAFLFVIVLLPTASGALGTKRNRRKGTEDKILYGSDAKQNEFPFVVYTNSTTLFHGCTGVLIDRRWVLTAGHCIGTGTQVVLGDYIRPEYDGTEQVVPIAETIRHPKYSGVVLNNIEFEINNDIGLIRLAKPANIRSDAVAQISTLKSKSFMEKMLANGKSCLALGWGLKDTPVSGIAFTDRLQKIRAYFVNETEDTARGYSTYLSEGVMGVEADYTNDPCKRASACFGDSGGPVICKQKGDWVVTGLISFGSKLDRCVTGVSGAVNVQRYHDWIKSNVN